MKNLLERIKRLDGASLGRPASAEDLAMATKKLTRNNLPDMPEELKKLLKKSDGLIYDGVEVLPVNPDNMRDADYMPRSIVDVNQKYAFSSFSRKWQGALIFGNADEEIYCFVPSKGKYVIVDRTGYDEYESFDSITDLLYSVLKIVK